MCDVAAIGAQSNRVAVLTKQSQLVVLDVNPESLDTRLAAWKQMIHGSGSATQEGAFLRPNQCMLYCDSAVLCGRSSFN